MIQLGLTSKFKLASDHYSVEGNIPVALPVLVTTVSGKCLQKIKILLVVKAVDHFKIIYDSLEEIFSKSRYTYLFIYLFYSKGYSTRTKEKGVQKCPVVDTPVKWKYPEV